METVAVTNPMVVARAGDLVLLVSGDDLDNRDTPAQTWEPGEGFSATKPLQIWFKFLYYIELVKPPEPWSEPA